MKIVKIWTLFAVGLFAASGSQAQDTEPNGPAFDVGTYWNSFVEQCSAVVEDYQTYRSSLPRPGPLGEEVEVVTEDGLLSRISTSRDGVPLNLFSFKLDDVTHVSCSVGYSFPEPINAAEVTLNFTDLLDSKNVRFVGGNISGDFVFAGPDLSIYRNEEPYYMFELSNVFSGTVDQISASFGRMSMTFTVGFRRGAP